MITQEELKEIARYDDGQLFWIKRGQKRTVGEPIGCVNSKGYVHTNIKSRWYTLHRLVWLYHYGYYPEHWIDHIDRVKTNNRIENLRDTTPQCNLRNTGNFKSNTSGVKGVYFNKSRNSFDARIRIEGVLFFLGSAKSKIEAVALRLAAEQAEDWAGCDSSSPAYQYMQKHLQS